MQLRNYAPSTDNLQRTAFVPCHSTGRPPEPSNISWPSSPIAMVSCTAFVLCHSTGRPPEPLDISWPSSPIAMVCCTACVLCHSTGWPPEPPDVSWPSSPIAMVSCTACVLCHSTGRPPEPPDISLRPQRDVPSGPGPHPGIPGTSPREPPGAFCRGLDMESRVPSENSWTAVRLNAPWS